ncbi:histidine phosphatase family protein [soil metagenome]
MHLYLIRHGQSLVNVADGADRYRDDGLTELGRRQAEAVAGRLADDLDSVDALYASTMRRATETASYLGAALGMPVMPDDRIREMGNNRLDHTPWPELPTDRGDFWPPSRPFASVTPAVERGESSMHFRTRVGAFVEDMVERHAGRNVVAVTHWGVIDMVFDHLFNVGAWRPCHVTVDHTAVTHIEALDVTPDDPALAHVGPERWRLHRHNDASHLYRLRAVAPVPADGTSASTTATDDGSPRI